MPQLSEVPVSVDAVIELPELLVPDVATWHAWLLDNHEDSPGVRLVLHKKGGTVTTLTYDQALDEALCVGWIDGQVNRRDEGSYYQRFAPRTKRSAWSARNVGHIARLDAEGRLLPAGRAAVEAARADGRWERAYEGSATATVPEDFARAIADNPAAAAQFEALTSQNRYAFIYRLSTVKTPAARQRNIDKFVEMLGRGELFHPQSGPKTQP
jgi:uncharacterized protein YdeI (YjbR/CyaY-like superfamily)